MEAGLIAVVLLMGYGLVAIPRALWREANPEARLRFAFYRCASPLPRSNCLPLNRQQGAWLRCQW